MNAFSNLGYSAENELSPDAWKQFMLQELDKRDYFEKERLARYQRAQAQMEANQKREALKTGIKDALSYGITSYMNKPGDLPANGPDITSGVEGSLNPSNVLDQFNQPLNYSNQPVKYPWEF